MVSIVSQTGGIIISELNIQRRNWKPDLQIEWIPQQCYSNKNTFAESINWHFSQMSSCITMLRFLSYLKITYFLTNHFLTATAESVSGKIIISFPTTTTIPLQSVQGVHKVHKYYKVSLQFWEILPKCFRLHAFRGDLLDSINFRGVWEMGPKSRSWKILREWHVWLIM